MAGPGQEKRREPALAESVSLTLSETDLFDSVGWKRVGCRNERGLGAITIFVGHVSELGRAALGEREAGNCERGHEKLDGAAEAHTADKSLIVELFDLRVTSPPEAYSPETTGNVALAL